MNNISKYTSIFGKDSENISEAQKGHAILMFLAIFDYIGFKITPNLARGGAKIFR